MTPPIKVKWRSAAWLQSGTKTIVGHGTGFTVDHDYQSAEGRRVDIWEYSNPTLETDAPQDRLFTEFSVSIKGWRMSRRYLRHFTRRGLMLTAAAFLRDAMAKADEDFLDD